jgi:hypothetical protein
MTEVHLGFVWKGQQRQAGARKQRAVYIFGLDLVTVVFT